MANGSFSWKSIDSEISSKYCILIDNIIIKIFLSVSIYLLFSCPGPCLYESGLTPKKLTFKEDAEVLNYGIGVTNIVPRTTRAADELSKYIHTFMYCIIITLYMYVYK